MDKYDLERWFDAYVLLYPQKNKTLKKYKRQVLRLLEAFNKERS